MPPNLSLSGMSREPTIPAGALHSARSRLERSAAPLPSTVTSVTRHHSYSYPTAAPCPLGGCPLRSMHHSLSPPRRRHPPASLDAVLLPPPAPPAPLPPPTSVPTPKPPAGEPSPSETEPATAGDVPRGGDAANDAPPPPPAPPTLAQDAAEAQQLRDRLSSLNHELEYLQLWSRPPNCAATSSQLRSAAEPVTSLKASPS